MAITDSLDLITHQHKEQPKFVAWITSPLQMIDDIEVLAATYPTVFYLSSAVGVQLDVIGAEVGVSRTLSFQPSVDSPILDDDTYRILISAKIIRNQWNGTLNDAYLLWYTLFPSTPIIITDNQDMTMGVLIIGALSTLLTEIISNGYIIPKPEGVLISYSFPPAAPDSKVGTAYVGYSEVT